MLVFRQCSTPQRSSARADTAGRRLRPSPIREARIVTGKPASTCQGFQSTSGRSSSTARPRSAPGGWPWLLPAPPSSCVSPVSPIATRRLCHRQTDGPNTEGHRGEPSRTRPSADARCLPGRRAGRPARRCRESSEPSVANGTIRARLATPSSTVPARRHAAPRGHRLCSKQEVA